MSSVYFEILFDNKFKAAVNSVILHTLHVLKLQHWNKSHAAVCTHTQHICSNKLPHHKHRKNNGSMVPVTVQIQYRRFWLASVELANLLPATRTYKRLSCQTGLITSLHRLCFHLVYSFYLHGE